MLSSGSRKHPLLHRRDQPPRHRPERKRRPLDLGPEPQLPCSFRPVAPPDREAVRGVVAVVARKAEDADFGVPGVVRDVRRGQAARRQLAQATRAAVFGAADQDETEAPPGGAVEAFAPFRPDRHRDFSIMTLSADLTARANAQSGACSSRFPGRTRRWQYSHAAVLTRYALRTDARKCW